MARGGLMTLAGNPLDSAIDNLDLAAQNAILRDYSPEAIVRWAS